MDEPTIHETEVDGVRCVWLDAARPFTAVLLFRVGMMDEPLRMRGISHLVEHLALLRFHGTETTFNGYVALRETGFVGEGPPDEVGAFLEEVCASLQDLPMDRIELETSVLRQEEAMAGTDPASVIATYYFGPRGLGVTTFPQFGLHWLGPSELEDWVSRYFTKENALLWTTGEPPSDWQLPLPRGEWRPIPEVDRSRTPAPEWPTLLEPGQGGAAWSSLVRQPVEDLNPDASFMVGLLASRQLSRLRGELGRVYGVGSAYERLTSEHAYLTMVVDTNPEHSREVSIEFLETFQTFADRGPTRDEMDAEVRKVRRIVEDHPEAIRRESLQRFASEKLAGWTTPAVHELPDVLAACDPDDLRERFAEAFRQSCMIADLPPETLAEREPSAYILDGAGPGIPEPYQRFRRKLLVNSNTAQQVLIGPAGLAIRPTREAGWRFIPVEDIALAYAVDGHLVVIGNRLRITFHAEMYQRSEAMLQSIGVWPDDILLPHRRWPAQGT